MQKEHDVTDGHIVHISSMAAHRVPGNGSSGIAMYSATKFAVRALTEGLRKELRVAKLRTRVTSISPGLVDTGFASHYMRGDQEKADRFFQKGVHDILQSSDVAEATLYALLAPAHCQVHDILLRPTEQAS
jgi:17beta-estradiol 17-dehydrogenase / 3beta-hydroxysteroid 3-dehydrogenase